MNAEQKMAAHRNSVTEIGHLGVMIRDWNQVRNRLQSRTGWWLGSKKGGAAKWRQDYRRGERTSRQILSLDCRGCSRFVSIKAD
jgi:hypothetical protein